MKKILFVLTLLAFLLGLHSCRKDQSSGPCLFPPCDSMADPACLRLLTPADGATEVPITPYFSWESCAEVDSFDLELLYLGYGDEWRTKDTLIVGTTHYQLECSATAVPWNPTLYRCVDGLAHAYPYRWRVSPHRYGREPEWTPYSAFTTVDNRDTILGTFTVTKRKILQRHTNTTYEPHPDATMRIGRSATNPGGVLVEDLSELGVGCDFKLSPINYTSYYQYLDRLSSEAIFYRGPEHDSFTVRIMLWRSFQDDVYDVYEYGGKFR